MFRLMATAAAGILLLAACGGGNGGSDEHAEPVEDYSYPVQMFEDEAPPIGDPGRHVGDAAVDYGTDPPTSGPHAGNLAPAGVYDTVVPDTTAVHNMEHGFVIVWHDCNGGLEPLSAEDCTRLRNDLSSVVSPAVADGKFVVMTPDTTMDQRIALTSWQFMDAFDEFDADRVQTFLDTFICHYDPEHSC